MRYDIYIYVIRRLKVNNSVITRSCADLCWLPITHSCAGYQLHIVVLVTPAPSDHKQMNCAVVLQRSPFNDQDEGYTRWGTQAGRTMGQPIAEETVPYRPVSQNV